MSLDGLVVTEEKLGEGGFGSVFVCELNGIKVAAKKLSQSESKFANIIREASRLKKLRYGKHIAYIHGITPWNEKLYMIMESSEHGDLQSYLKRSAGSITYEQKILFCRGILLGLLYCHSMKVYHGDIKCSNVILGKNMEPKLIDFGLSMTVDNIEGYCKKYEGSIHWTAPELFSVDDEYNFKEFKANLYPTDVYSLGATFCEVSYDGTTEFIDSEDIEMNISLGLVSPIPKDGFLEEIVDGCCQFERNERISLDECLTMLDIVAEEQFLVPVIDDKWQVMEQDIKANSKLEIPPSFILHRLADNLVVGPSNLSLLEWLCINNCRDAVDYMIRLHNPEQKQIGWLYGISYFSKSQEVAAFLQKRIQGIVKTFPELSDLMDNNPQQFIESIIKAGAYFHKRLLLGKAIEKHYNKVVQLFVDSKVYFSNWNIHLAIKSGNREAVRIFANAGFDLEYIDYHNENTPLLAAIETGNVEIVKILLDFDVDIHNGNQYTPLHLAALKGNYEMAELLINAGATINTESNAWKSLAQQLKQQGKLDMIQFILHAKDKSSIEAERKLTLLCKAIRERKTDTVRNLIDGRVDVGERSYDRYAPLHWAVISGNQEATVLLIEAGADVDSKTPSEDHNFYISSSPDYFNKCAPIHIAVIKGHLGIARLLIESGADFSAKDGLGRTIIEAAPDEGGKSIEKIVQENAPTNTASLRRAAGSMNLETVRVLLSRQRVSVDILSDCLCIAAYNGSDEVVKYMIKCGANMNNKYEYKNSLEWAISGDHIQIVQILLKAGVDTNTNDNHKGTVLFQCIKESQKEMAEFLISKGANISIKDMYGNTPIHFAKDKETVQILINAGADVNAVGKYGETPLFQHVRESQKELIQFLVEKGTDVNAKDMYGCSPIHYAKDRETAEILINAGANINAKNKYGEALLFQYVKRLQIDIVQLLVNKGADVNAKDMCGCTPIHYAKDRKIAEILISHGADINAKKQQWKNTITISYRGLSCGFSAIPDRKGRRFKC